MINSLKLVSISFIKTGITAKPRQFKEFIYPLAKAKVADRLAKQLCEQIIVDSQRLHFEASFVFNYVFSFHHHLQCSQFLSLDIQIVRFQSALKVRIVCSQRYVVMRMTGATEVISRRFGI